MKRILCISAAVIVAAGILFLLANIPPKCPICEERNELLNCPICYNKVCVECFCEEYYVENLYNSGKMEEYLEERGYVVFPETQDAFSVYAYGFLSGYQKGKDGIMDDEVEEFLGWDYEWLNSNYGAYGY